MPIPLNEIQLFTNNAVTLLAAPIGPTDTSLTVMVGYGNLFPAPGPGEFFLVTLEDQSASTREIVKVTGRTGDTFTGLQRGMEGTTPQSWGASLGNDTLVDHRVTAETLTRAMQLPLDTVGAQTLDDLTDVDLSTPPVAGQVLKFNGSQWSPGPDNSGSSGTVTSVGLTVPSFLSVAGSPVTTSGTLAVSLVSQPAGLVLAGPLTGSGVPSFRTLGLGELGGVDTTTTPPVIGQVLAWDGINWIPQNNGDAWINGANAGPTMIDPGWDLPISSVTYTDDNRGFKFIVTITMPSNGATQTFEVLANVSGNIVANTETVTHVKYGRTGYNFLGNLTCVLTPVSNLLELKWQNDEAAQVRVRCVRIQHMA